MSDAAAFAFALSNIESIGKVTAAKLLRIYGTPDALAGSTRTVLQDYLHGRHNSGQIMDVLQDEEALEKRVQTARKEIRALRSTKGIKIFVPGDDDWPTRIDELPVAARPFPLYAWGNAAILKRPVVAFFAPRKVSAPIEEKATALAGQVLDNDLVLCTAAAQPMDVSLQNQCKGRPSILVADSGMSKVKPSFRETATAAKRAGGVLLSAFPPDHGPYERDKKPCAQLMAALASCCVFIEPVLNSPDWEAMDWSCTKRKSVFAWPAEGHDLPRHVHEIKTRVDPKWVPVAARLRRTRTTSNR